MKYLYTCVLAILFFTTSDAQCWLSPNTLTTEVGATGSNNTFDWTLEYNTVYLRDEYNPVTGNAPPRQITMPMYAQSNSTLQNYNLLAFQNMSAALKDHLPADGWE